jgi:hypothetical protein
VAGSYDGGFCVLVAISTRGNATIKPYLLDFSSAAAAIQRPYSNKSAVFSSSVPQNI